MIEKPLDERTAEENATVIIKNGTMISGLAAKTQEFLETNNINVISVDNADQIYSQTTIIDYRGKPYTVNYISELLKIAPNKIYQRFEPDSEADIIVILGEDWGENNNLPE